MKLDITNNNFDNSRVFTITTDIGDTLCSLLDQFDWKLIRECEGSKKISDKLMMLQTIAFRLEQEAEYKKKSKLVEDKDNG